MKKGFDWIGEEKKAKKTFSGHLSNQIKLVNSDTAFLSHVYRLPLIPCWMMQRITL
jgi:hypothetical protein